MSSVVVVDGKEKKDNGAFDLNRNNRQAGLALGRVKVAGFELLQKMSLETDIIELMNSTININC